MVASKNLSRIRRVFAILTSEGQTEGLRKPHWPGHDLGCVDPLKTARRMLIMLGVCGNFFTEEISEMAKVDGEKLEPSEKDYFRRDPKIKAGWLVPPRLPARG